MDGKQRPVNSRPPSAQPPDPLGPLASRALSLMRETANLQDRAREFVAAAAPAIKPAVMEADRFAKIGQDGVDFLTDVWSQMYTLLAVCDRAERAGRTRPTVLYDEGADRWLCPVCPDPNPYKDPVALGNHLERAHGYSAGERIDAFGNRPGADKEGGHHA